MQTLVKKFGFRAVVAGAALGLVGVEQAHATDSLATLVTAVDFTTLATDVVTVGVALAALYVVWTGVKWILRMIRHA
jgi:uncharacterized membrane protein